jgi:hypothetical protein
MSIAGGNETQFALTGAIQGGLCSMKLRDLIIPVGLILAVAATRLIPHPPNFTPIMSVALFGSAVLANRYLGIVVAIVAMALSNLVLGGHSTWAFVYGAMLVTGILGFTLREKRSIPRILVVTLTGSILFFLISNLGVFIMQDLYPKTAAGLLTCYTLALPFFKNTIAGDFLFTGVLFSLHYLLTRRSEGNQIANAA